MTFPSSPIDGQTYTQFGRTFTYSSTLGSWRTFRNSDVDTSGAITSMQLTANSAASFANGAFTKANTGSTLGKSIATSIVFGG